jgi:4-hydroxybenzoate polyprenyltransferase
MQSLMQKLSPYIRLMRMHQPVGVWLVYWPCVWAILLAAGTRNDLPAHTAILLLALFFLGALVTRAGGCIINDLADRDFDRQVERTKTRPLASGELRPLQALAVLAVCAVLALTVLLTLLDSLPPHVQPNQLLVVTLPVVALIVAYPFMKRITWWPQAFLGLTFNWGVLISWVAIDGNLPAAAYALYAACVLWTLGYDTVYGHQDKRDDERIGIKSTSRHLEKHRKLWIGIFYGAMAVLLFSACLLRSMPLPMAQLLLLLTVLHTGWQVLRWNPDDPADCLRVFKSNVTLGGLLSLCLAVV